MPELPLSGEDHGNVVLIGSRNHFVAVSTNAELEHPTFAVIEPVRSFDNASMNDWRVNTGATTLRLENVSVLDHRKITNPGTP